MKPLDVLADEIGLPVSQLVKLDANENLYGAPAAGVRGDREGGPAHLSRPGPNRAPRRHSQLRRRGPGADRCRHRRRRPHRHPPPPDYARSRRGHRPDVRHVPLPCQDRRGEGHRSPPHRGLRGRRGRCCSGRRRRRLSRLRHVAEQSDRERAHARRSRSTLRPRRAHRHRRGLHRVRRRDVDPAYRFASQPRRPAHVQQMGWPCRASGRLFRLRRRSSPRR